MKGALHLLLAVLLTLAAVIAPVMGTTITNPPYVSPVTQVLGTTAEIDALTFAGLVTLSLPIALTFTNKTITGGTFASPTLSGTVAGTYTLGGTPSIAYTALTGLGTGVATFLGTPSSANLAAAVTGETGSGALVFGTSPTFTTSTILAGSSSGTVTQVAQAVAGTPTITYGTSSGTPAVTASSPLAITAATGNATCATCTTNAAALTANALVIGGGSQASAALGSLGTTTTLLHGNASGAPTFSAVATGDIAANAVTSPKLAVVNTYWICSMSVGATDGAVLTDANIGPQDNYCLAPAAITIVEVYIKADAGTPTILPRRVTTTGTATNFLSAALATAASGGIACARTSAVTSVYGTTTCSSTLNSTALAAGSKLGIASGVAGGVAKQITAWVIGTID